MKVLAQDEKFILYIYYLGGVSSLKPFLNSIATDFNIKYLFSRSKTNKKNHSLNACYSWEKVKN